MELRSSIAFIGEQEILEIIDFSINEESILDDMVFSVDFIPDLETDDTYVYRCYTADDESWVNIYEIKNRVDAKLEGNKKYDIIYTCTDSKTYVEVISCTGNFDAYVDTDTDKIQEICDTYGLEFYGSTTDDDEDYYGEDDNDEDNYY